MILREMKAEDSVQIAELEQEIFTDAWTKNGIEETFQQKHTFVAVAEDEQQIKGYGILYYVLDEAEIARIAVHERTRQEGIGSRILEFCEEICREKGIVKLLLDVRGSNMPARRFYEKSGFLIDGMRNKFYENPCEDAVLMSKQVI